MRIITGTARGIPLLTLPGDNTRPTLEKAKEAIFSILQFDIEGRKILDLFAGSGQMALEALSRGASYAVMVDKSKDAIEILQKNAQKTRLCDNCSIVCSDYSAYLNSAKEAFDIVFLDPPYASDYIEVSLGLLEQKGLLKPSSILICETDKDQILFDEDKYTLVKKSKYGIAYVYFLTPKQK